MPVNGVVTSGLPIAPLFSILTVLVSVTAVPRTSVKPCTGFTCQYQVPSPRSPTEKFVVETRVRIFVVANCALSESSKRYELASSIAVQAKRISGFAVR